MKLFHPAEDITIAIDSVPAASEALTARQRERKAVASLLMNLLGDVELKHDKNGKPLIDGYNISISHSINRKGGFVSVILSRTRLVGIDIEYRSDRIMKIASRFLRDDEKPVSVEDNLISWCAKEAVYKLFSEDDLTYQEMRVDNSKSLVENLRRGIQVGYQTISTPEYILVWTEK